MHFLFKAFWDEQANVWVADNDELGIATEAESLDVLAQKIRLILPEAMSLNGLTPDDDTLPYDLLIHDSQRTPAHA